MVTGMENEYFLSINEVSKHLSVPAHTLRYWEKQFPSLIRPTTGAGGRRYYRRETFERLVIIKDLLYTRGLTIAGVKKLMRDGDLPKNLDDFLAASAMSPDTIASAMPSSPRGASSDEIKFAIDLLTSARNLLQ
ncbi:MAG: MerR family transcriptional regulator [Alphaproteobacteria bacterium]|nr:MerR family transcriptional regulator [Alphaproteobacteria bacterium]